MFDNEEDTLVYNRKIEKFEAYIAPRKNLTYSWFKFQHINKKRDNVLKAFSQIWKSLPVIANYTILKNHW